MACLHCGSDCTAKELKESLNISLWLSIIDYCKEKFTNDLTFIFTGGEPLLYSGLISLGRRIVENGMRWSMVTNGILLNHKMLKKLIKAGIYSITISLDGLKESHNKLRGSSIAYQKALSAIQITGNSDIPVKDVVTCVYPDNNKELDSIAELLIERNINYWRLFRIFPSGRAGENMELLLSFSETQGMLSWIKNNKGRLKKRGLIVNASCEGFLPFKEDSKVRDAPYFCRAGINIASILNDGSITGCANNNPEFYEGNIQNDDLAKIWKSGFRRFRDREWSKKGACGECSFFKDCLGNSIHLWYKGADKPAFCYVKDINKESTKAEK